MANTAPGTGTGTTPSALHPSAAAASGPVRPQGGSDQGTDSKVEGILEQGGRLRDEAGLLATHVGEALGALGSLARNQLDQRLYTTLSSAAGIGYVLGGGLPLRLVTLAVGLGLRQMGGRALIRLLSEAKAKSPATPSPPDRLHRSES